VKREPIRPAKELKRPWHFLPDPDEGTETEVEDFKTLFSGLERTYLLQFQKARSGSDEKLLAVVLAAVFDELRKVTDGVAWTRQRGRAVLALFEYLQTMTNLGAAMGADGQHEKIARALKRAIPKNSSISVGKLEAVLMNSEEAEDLKRLKPMAKRKKDRIPLYVRAEELQEEQKEHGGLSDVKAIDLAVSQGYGNDNDYMKYSESVVKGYRTWRMKKENASSEKRKMQR
jgi:hypothetical protein